ncbi:Zinc knuckle CX2CX4HX4C [Sesbania bispinosa]|nr:Zinc knuckle CX2CX4HX4C [Sesbania bispinosa]
MADNSPILLTSLEVPELILEAGDETELRTTQRMLGQGEDLKISDLGPNAFLFSFTEAKHARKALDEGPWFFMGHLLSLQPWKPEASLNEVEYNMVSFWVQLHGLPLEHMSDTNAVKIAKLWGDIELMESPFWGDTLLRSFLRVRIVLDIRKPLVTGFLLPRKNRPKTWISIKYERLQGFCYFCGIIGHDFRKCTKPQAMAVLDESRPSLNTNPSIPATTPIPNPNPTISQSPKPHHTSPNPTSSSQNPIAPNLTQPITLIDLESGKEDIQKCKNTWLLADTGIKPTSPKYYVEFPPEYDGPSTHIDAKEEHNLINGFQRQISLKRGRQKKILSITEGAGFGDCVGKRQRINQENVSSDSSRITTAEAEEPFRDQPWALIGDFNEILDPSEKEGIRPSNSSSMLRFRNFVDSANLMDLELKGASFTWFSNPRQGQVIREKIDRKWNPQRRVGSLLSMKFYGMSMKIVTKLWEKVGILTVMRMEFGPLFLRKLPIAREPSNDGIRTHLPMLPKKFRSLRQDYQLSKMAL